MCIGPKKYIHMKFKKTLKKLNDYFNFIRGFKALNDHRLRQADVLIFVSPTLFVKNSTKNYESEIAEKLLDYLTDQSYRLDKILFIGIPPFFLPQQELMLNVNRINYSYLRYILREVLLRQVSLVQANTTYFTELINFSHAKVYYATNYYPFLNKLNTRALHSEYLHGYAYRTLPAYFNEDVNHLFEIICFDKYSAESVKRDSKTSKTVCVILENESSRRSSVVKKPTELDKYRKVCLYTVSVGYYKIDAEFGHEILDNGICPESFLAWIQEKQDIAFIFRPHPTHFLVKYKGLMKTLFQLEEKYANIYVHKFQNWSLKEVLRISDVHFTMSSNSVYFASNLGVLSYSLCHNIAKGGDREEYMGDLEEAGFLIKMNYKTIDYNLCVE